MTLLILALAGWFAGIAASAPLSTSFTYQGQLVDGAGPANGLYDLRFSVFETPTGSGIVSTLITNTATAITNGHFTVTLDFGAGVFDGSDRWLQIGVRTNGGNAFVALSPRHPLTPTPYAVFAPNAGLATLASGVSTGAVTSAMLADGAVTTAKIGAGAVKPANIDDEGTAAYAELMNAGRGMQATEVLPFSDLSLIVSNTGLAPSLTFRLNGSSFGKVLGFTGREGLSEVYEYVVQVLNPHGGLVPDEAIRQPGVLQFTRNGRMTVFAGTITGCAQATYNGGALYTFRLEPALSYLSLNSDYRLYQESTATDIVEGLYQEITGLNAVDSLSGSYATRTLAIQFAETDLNFFNRLLEDEGIFYFFRHEEASTSLVLGDARASYLPAPNGELSYYGNYATNPPAGAEYVRVFQKAARDSTRIASLNGYDFSAPRKDLRASSTGPGGRGERYEFNARVTEKGDMDALAHERRERMVSEQSLVNGTGSAPDLRPGYTFLLNDSSGAGLGGEYVITSVRHAAFRRTTNNVTSFYYGNQFEALPASIPYRPARKAPKPAAPACTAVVTGKSGEEIWTDKYGRVKVQFHWDRRGTNDDRSSGWIRVATQLAGKNWGAISVPRIGQEVLVEFVNGDPDQPVITGSFYNGENMPPYTLPAEATKSGIKTRSSKGGTMDNYNEIRFEDKKGSEEIYIKAEKDLNLDVNRDATVWMGNDLTWEVVHDMTLRSKHDLSVTADNNLPVSVGYDLPISAGHNLTLSATNDLVLSSGRGVGINTANDPTLALKVGGTVAAGTFQGSGAALTNLSASALTTGTISDARLSSSVFFLSGSQTITGAKTFSSAANVFHGNGSNLTSVNADQLDGQHGAYYLNAGNLNAGTLSDVRLSYNIPRLDGSQSFSGNNAFLGRMSVGGSMGLETLTIYGTTRHNDYDLYFRASPDQNHGLGWYGSSKLFAGVNVDGPVLYGCDGGGLGTSCNQSLALRWRNDGNVMIDPRSLNTGALLPGLTFGGFSGEGISSKRNAGGNQFGLDFYTYNTNRLSITQNGSVGIGTNTPTHLLHLHTSSTNTMRLTSTGGNGAGAKINFGDAEYVYLQEVSDDFLRVQATRIGIARTPVANRLEVEGDASKTTAGSWFANSDARIKTDVATVTNALETLARVRPVSFRYSDEYRAAHPDIADHSYINVVAQEFREVFPDAVKTSGETLADGSEILQVDTHPLTLYSAAAVTELNRKVEDLRAELKRHEMENAELMQRLARLERMLAVRERP